MSPATEEMLTIDPDPASLIAGRTALIPKKTPFEFTSCIRSHSSSEVSSTPFSNKIPALLTKISIWPCASKIRCMTESHWFSSVTSRGIYWASPPISFNSASSFFPSSSKTSVIITLAPS